MNTYTIQRSIALCLVYSIHMSIMFYMSHAIQNSCALIFQIQVISSTCTSFTHIHVMCSTCTCTYCYIYLNCRNRLFWIGGYRKNSTWYWVGDANNITMDVQPGDPVDFNNPGSTSRGQCAALTEDYSVYIGVYKSSYEFADNTFGYTRKYCDGPNYYLCEREKLSVPTVSPTHHHQQPRSHLYSYSSCYSSYTTLVVLQTLLPLSSL